MDHLARREHSRAELEQKLAKKDFDSALINQVLNRLREESLQSDERFAEAYITSRARKGFGPLRMVLELGQKGLSESLIDNALADVDINWLDEITRVWQKRFNGQLPQDLKEKAKQTQFLHYRGFDADLIKELYIHRSEDRIVD